ncbi:breast cancer type 2 susceptibility protein homolog [Topomyia yanbarensis]|uniref:breast cancer type 2 susceptibility protein homolog n=1 Tax=Topomyia yanbarensis TaxID=2498891 RepID=UPI00273BEE4E|nr:breast cancer type 2 susceptibility protein homolog [Topomyia yanbarensis]
MDEVPASPELVKRKKSRRITNQIQRRSRLSLNRDKRDNDQDTTEQSSILVDGSAVANETDGQDERLEQLIDANLLYLDDNTEPVVFADEDPLVFAAILEKANQIELEHAVKPSREFLANVKHKFVKIKEVIEPPPVSEHHAESEAKKQGNALSKKNYSYTQFDLDTQMIGICEAADILADLNSAPDQELKDWSSPISISVKPELVSQRGIGKCDLQCQQELSFRRKYRWCDVRQSSLSRDGSNDIFLCKTPPMTDSKRTNNFDFSDESDADLSVDYCKIKSLKLRQQLAKIQSYIDSPPQLVNKTNNRRTFSKKSLNSGPRTPNVIRRLSYERSENLASENDQTSSSSDDEMECLDGLQSQQLVEDIPQRRTSLEGDDFNASLLIKANIHQLSQFFLKSAESCDKPERDTESLEQEPPFHGFVPEPSSPISLVSSGSPRTLNIAWLFSQSESELYSDGEAEIKEHNLEDPLHQLLDDDDEFLVQLHSSQHKHCDDKSEKQSMRVKNNLDANDSLVVLEDRRNSMTTPTVPHSSSSHFNNKDGMYQYAPSFGGFQTAGGSGINVSEKAMAKARSIWNEEEDRFTTDAAWVKATEQDTCAVSDNPVPPLGGFTTAGGSSITVSKSSLAKADEMWKTFDTDVDSMAALDNKFTSAGFQTARGNSVKLSDSALVKAHHMFQQWEREDNTREASSSALIGNKIKIPEQDKIVGCGFQTAQGNSIPISESALNKAHKIFEEIERYIDYKNERLPTTVTQCSNNFNLCGFQTANGKSVHVSESALAKAQTIFQQIEAESVNMEPVIVEKSGSNMGDQASKRLREYETDIDPETPLKRHRPNGRLEVEIPFSTSTPNIPSKVSMQSEDGGMEHFFEDLNDQEFHHLFASEDSMPRKLRPLKQVRLVNRFEECDVKSPTAVNNSGGGHWDDSFGDLVAKLSAELSDGLKIAQQILDARRFARQRQLDYVQNKPHMERKPRLHDFVRKKQLRNRKTLEELVGDLKPSNFEGELPAYIRLLNVENATEFKFDMLSLYGKSFCIQNVDGIPLALGEPDAIIQLHLDDHCLTGVSEIRSAFLAAPGVDPSLVPSGWVENAWKWILIKLSSMERNFYKIFTEITTPENVINQLLYRYHVEIDCAKRPVIRKILEKDEVATKRMVLFVSRVFRGQDPSEVELELSDGWYPVRTVIDVPLTEAVLKGKITVGTKLMIQGAELLNLNEGCSPLETPGDVRLKIHANSTRRTRWATKLGLYKVPKNFLISCNDILDQGGLIVCLQLVVVRVYPLMYVDKSQRNVQGSVLRSERVERRHTLANDASRFESFQALFSQVQKEFDAERNHKIGNGFKKIPTTLSSAELPELLDAGVDFTCLEIDFTATQRDTIVEHQRRQQEECLNEINRRVKERMNSQATNRKVSPLLKVRVMDVRKPEKVLLLSIWRPPEDIDEIMQESNVLEIRNATASGTRNGETQLTTGKSSTYQLLNQQVFDLPVGHLRKLTTIADIEISTFCPLFNEFDTIGVVVQVGSSEAKKFQTAYFADTAMNILCVNFWYGIKEYAYEDMVKERVVLCISNLQWRTINAMNVIPNAFATEYTTFSEHSKVKHFAEALSKFQATLNAMDLETFLNECCIKITQLKEKKLPRSSSLNTPIRVTDSLHSFNASTPVRSVLGNSNVLAKTPVDFSPGVGQPISAQKRRIQLLEAAYRSPPKLTPIVMRSNPRARKNFRIPAKLEDRIEQTREDDSVC